MMCRRTSVPPIASNRAHRRRSHPCRRRSILVRDAQRVIESIEALVRIHNAQEEDIYKHAVAAA
jgi:hypothetical protein